MAGLNVVVLVGNLTRDPELRFTPNGTPVANFGIAVNRRPSKTEGQQDVDFFNIVAWGRLAELCGDYISKGSPVAIDGRLQYRSWDADDGSKRSVVEVVAENVQFLSSKGQGGGDGQSSGDTSAPIDEDIPF